MNIIRKILVISLIIVCSNINLQGALPGSGDGWYVHRFSVQVSAKLDGQPMANEPVNIFVVAHFDQTSDYQSANKYTSSTGYINVSFDFRVPDFYNLEFWQSTTTPYFSCENCIFVERTNDQYIGTANWIYVTFRLETDTDVDNNGIEDVNEMPLAEKFAPSLVLHSGDQGVSPEPVDIMNVDMTIPDAFMYVKAWTSGGQEVCFEYPTHADWSPPFFGPYGWFSENGDYSSYEGSLFGTNVNPPDYACVTSLGPYYLVMHPDWGGQDCDTPSEWYALYEQLGPQYPHTIYPHLFKNGSEYVIQYWMFYPFNAFINRHEGDWEHINVVINSQNPSDAQIIRVEYFFHHYVLERYPPDEFHVVDQTHPVIFVGGHGSLELGMVIHPGQVRDLMEASRFLEHG